MKLKYHKISRKTSGLIKKMTTLSDRKQQADKHPKSIFQTFKALKIDQKAPYVHTCVLVHILFHFMFSLKRKSRLVAESKMKRVSDEENYSELVNIYTHRTNFFFENIKGIYVDDVYFGNISSRGFTKQKISNVAVSRKYKRDDLLTNTLFPHKH